MFRRLTLTNVDTGLSSGATSRSSIPLIQLHISTVTGLMWHGAKFGGFHGSQMLVWLGLGTETLRRNWSLCNKLNSLRNWKVLHLLMLKHHLAPSSLVWHHSYLNATLPTKKLIHVCVFTTWYDIKPGNINQSDNTFKIKQNVGWGSFTDDNHHTKF